MLDTSGIDRLIPAWKDMGAPVTTEVSRAEKLIVNTTGACLGGAQSCNKMAKKRSRPAEKYFRLFEWQGIFEPRDVDIALRCIAHWLAPFIKRCHLCVAVCAGQTLDMGGNRVRTAIASAMNEVDQDMPLFYKSIGLRRRGALRSERASSSCRLSFEHWTSHCAR